MAATDAEFNWKDAKSIYEFTMKDIDDNMVKLDRYRGKVLLVVNVACECGLTKANYEQMKTLYERLGSRGFVTLAFPSNQFMGQEPGSNAEIKRFVTEHYGGPDFVDLFSKLDVNGANASPLYKWLKTQQGGTLTDAIKWNFTKFLIDTNGHAVKRYGPTTEPKDIAVDVEQYLDARDKAAK